MVVQSWVLDHSIVHFRLNPANPREAFVVVRKHKKAEAGGAQKKSSTTSVLYRLDLHATNLVRVAKARHYEAMAVSPTGRFVAVASGKKLLLCGIDGSGSSERTFTHDLDITTIDFHPTASYLAYGDTNGRISLLYFMTGTDGQAPLTSVMHWHAHKVATLRFTSDGEQLLSGGEESVLVVWHLQSRQKSFLPRLGSEVASLQMSPDGQMYGVGLADNSVKIVMASNLAVKQSVEGMRFGGLTIISSAGARSSSEIRDLSQSTSRLQSNGDRLVWHTHPIVTSLPFSGLASSNSGRSTATRMPAMSKSRRGTAFLERKPGNLWTPKSRMRYLLEMEIGWRQLTCGMTASSPSTFTSSSGSMTMLRWGGL
jgi:WD40 repeat protein